jgi:myosin-5
MCQTIYERCFSWIVKKIDCSLGADREARLVVGVLDFPGFEENGTGNSLEQLWINYTDEVLQNAFNQQVFQLEQVMPTWAAAS